MLRYLVGVEILFFFKVKLWNLFKEPWRCTVRAGTMVNHFRCQREKYIKEEPWILYIIERKSKQKIWINKAKKKIKKRGCLSNRSSHVRANKEPARVCVRAGPHFECNKIRRLGSRRGKKKENWFLTKVQDIVLQRVKELPTTHQFSVSATFMPCCFMFRKEKNYIYKDGLVWSVV